MPALYLPDLLREALAREARDASPRECCGLIEGIATPEGWRAVALHGSRNLAAEPEQGFRIDPEVHFALLHALRGSGRAIIGCYHSHPGGPCEPSARDREEAMDDGFVWLIAADGAIAAHVFDARARDFAPLTLLRSG